MSRVEEARRRAEGRDLQDDRSSLTGIVGSTGDRERVLERYPCERRELEVPKPVQPAAAIAAPRVSSSGHLGALDPSLAGKLVGSPDTPAIAVEQYRRLAASLHELQVDTGLKTVMVTSAMPRDGKSLTVTNLALTLSESYRKQVLLIDADLRRPSLHQVFRLPKTVGLSEALKSGSRPHFLELSSLLSVLPAGEVDGDPLSALTSSRFATLLEHCVATFDWVLLDAPPVGLMPDGNLLARLTKAVVFVIGAGSTPHAVVERALAEIGRDTIVGAVLNRIDVQRMPGGGEYDEYYRILPPSE